MSISTPRVGRMLRGALHAVMNRVARAYVTGPHLADALQASYALHRQGFRSTICYWNSDNDVPQNVARQYLAAVNAVGDGQSECTVSVKAPPLKFSRELLTDVLRRARERDVTIHFDAQSIASADPTFDLLGELVSEHTRIGCTLPGRWRRSPVDAVYAAELGLRVRVVKGQWADSVPHELDPRIGFLKVIDRLAGRTRHVSVATHDPALAREALARLRRAGTACELELLLGLPMRDALLAARGQGVPVRLYLPYGRAWLPYAVDRIKRSPRIAWWIARDLFTAAQLAGDTNHPRLPRRLN
jgi:proline dehydrogenase